MKKKALFINLLSLSLIASCSFSTSSIPNSSISSSKVISSSENSSIENSVASSISSTVSSESSSSISSSSSTIELKNLTINSTNYDKIGSYSTNFESVSLSGYYFFHYRAFDPNDSAFLSLLPYDSYVDDKSHEGSFFNTTPIYGIRNITITYETKNDNKPLLLLGESKDFEYIIELEPSSSKITKSFTLDDYNFFKVDTNDNETKIYSISIDYTNIREQYDERLLGSGDNEYRLNPVQVDDELIPGVTTVTVPTEVNYTSNGYDVLKTKTYTYYTLDYVKSNPSVADEAALVDPIDIAAYYSSFKTHPANYVAKREFNSAKTYFGDKTRCISTYSRTSGYATSVPWQAQPSMSSPLYHELDIDCEPPYSSSNRGVGRLVVWYYGFTSNGYDDSPICTYTSDHYKTFQEYMNDGTFGRKFNAEGSVTNYKFSPSITKN